MASEIAKTAVYHRTAALLDDCAALARLARAAATVEARTDPVGVALMGGRRLRAATWVGFIAGSFNPLTRAHLALANAARRVAGLDTIIWVCAAVSVDKERVERATLVDRLAQMRVFVAGRRHEALVLLNRGLYVDEARILRPLLPPTAGLHILVGYDKIVQIFDPKYYTNRDATLRELFALADILVAPRGADGAAALSALLAHPANRPFAAHVHYLDVPHTYASDSSSEARALAARTYSDDAALMRLLPPAGMALAQHTRAYQRVPPGEADAYGMRERWLAALATLPKDLAHQLPPLSALVRRTLADDVRGAAMHAWLETSPHDEETLLSLL
jgi:nicotinamide-nucleotide adenylyltransferase